MAAPAEPAKTRASSLTLRILSTAVLIPVVAVAAYLGHPLWDLLVILFGGVMIWEWCGIASKSRPADRKRWGITTAAIALVVAVLASAAFGTALPPALDLLEGPGFFIAAVIAVTLGALPSFGRAAFWFTLGMVYVLIPCLAIIALRSDPVVGLPQILWIVALVIAADTGAYIAGRSIGGPKLAPRISPNKTWAGLGGAVVSAAVVGAITAVILGRPSLVPLMAVSAGLAIVEQAGDLAESAFKRRFGVKDASNIIPGHGGALDRVDGLIAVAAAVAGINAWIGSSVLTWL